MDKWYKKGKALLNEIQDTDYKDEALALWFIGQCGFICKFAGKSILIDPVLNDIQDGNGNSRRHYVPPFSPDEMFADFVLCTHGHIDHMAGETLLGLVRCNPNVKIVIPCGCETLALSYGLPKENLLTVQDESHIILQDAIAVDAFSTAHPVHILDDNSGDMSLGYCLVFGDMHLVHLGDTYLTERLLNSLMKHYNPNIFLPPINGDDYFRMARNCIGNMEAEEAAKLAAHICADLTIPTHYDMIMNNTVDPLRFAAELRAIAPTAKWHIPVLGERILYSVR